MEENQIFQEAPASANVRVVSKNGYEWQITMRTNSVGQLFKQIEVVENLLKSSGWEVPEWKKQKNGISEAKKEENLCPDCKSPLKKIQVKKEGKNKGRWFWACSNKGCKFFKWA